MKRRKANKPIEAQPDVAAEAAASVGRPDPSAADAVPAASDGDLAAVNARLDNLTDLFRRRLLEDKTRERALDDLHNQLELARDGLIRDYLRPLLLELLLVIDRIERMESTNDTRDGLDSVRAELLDVLGRRGVEEIPAEGQFDASIHEAVGTQPADESLAVGSVYEVTRRGYRWAAGVVRPARVVVAVATRSISTPEPSKGEGEPSRVSDGNESPD